MGLADEPRARRWDWGVAGLIAALVLIAIVATVAGLTALNAASETRKLAGQNARTLQRIEMVRAASRNQTCTLFERQEASNVQRVVGTYAYLDHLPSEERGTTLTQAIIRALPDTYREAKASKAPTYCDAPGVGLSESATSTLPRERDFRDLLRKGGR